MKINKTTIGLYCKYYKERILSCCPYLKYFKRINIAFMKIDTSFTKAEQRNIHI